MLFSFAKGPFSDTIWPKFVSAVKASIEKADWDSGVIPTPSDKIVKHPLGQLPAEVWVYASDNADGSSFDSDTWTACTTTQITVTGPKAFCRVRMRLGG